MNKRSKALFGSFVPAFRKGFTEIKLHFGRLTLRILLLDLLLVAASIGFIIVPAFIVGLILILLPQGRDALLLVVEKTINHNFFPLVFLLLSVTAWSVISELGVRYAIYISDNSGKNLSDERVAWRKTAQKLLAATFLLAPFLIVMIGLLWTLAGASYLAPGVRYPYFAFCILLIYWLMSALSNLYFAKFGSYRPGISLKTRLGARSLPDQEQYWLKKLYGIYNDFIYELPKASSFKGVYKEDLRTFTDHFTKADGAALAAFPQNQEVLTALRVVPESFILTNKDKVKKGEGELYKWNYCIPTSFYRGLHRQVAGSALFALFCFIGVSIIPVKTRLFEFVGAPALICLAFACYSGIYSGLLFLDHALLRSWKISVRFLLVIVFVASSILNSDHPVRMGSQNYPRRNSLNSQFRSWFTAYRNRIDAVQPGTDTARQYPVVFICAEGGALRTGAFTALFLSELQDSLQNHYHVDLKRSVFAMSGVSGGALGLGFYNAVTYKRAQRNHDNRSLDETKRFFLFDALSPLVGKMFFGDFLNLFIPWPISLFDRATALEQAWEMAYRKAVGRHGENNFEESFMRKATDTLQPMLVINTTEIETGLQCWISNIRPDSLLFAKKRDLLGGKVKQLRYSTAINFSTRFPLFSPGGKIGGEGGVLKYHYLDGGYVENTGTGTMLEILQSLEKDLPEFKKVIPVVITLRFSDNSADTSRNIHGFNELSEIFNGIYNTRAGRSNSARQQLQTFTQRHHGVTIDEPLTQTEKDVPMNWVLSDQSLGYILKDVKGKLDNRKPDGIFSQLLQSRLHYIPYLPVRDTIKYVE
jgi:hypothetical protein